LANLSVTKQLDFADSDVEIIDVGGLYSPHSPADEEDIHIDDIKTASDLPETHKNTHTLVENLGTLLSAQSALSATALAGDLPLTPPSYTGGLSDLTTDGILVDGDFHGVP